MNQEIISKETMDSLKVLSQINLKISEAKNLLFELEKGETDYLEVREKKAMDRIQVVLDSSREMVAEADQNHNNVQELLNGLSVFVGNIIKLSDGFTSLISEFEERNVLWEKDVGEQQDSIVQIRNKLKAEAQIIENEKKNIVAVTKRQTEDQRKIDADRGTIKRTMDRLKIKRI